MRGHSDYTLPYMAGEYFVVVDDEQQIVEAVTRELRSWVNEHELLLESFTNPVEARDFLLENGDKVALVLSDQRMPSLNGSAMLNAVREEYPGLVALILSGQSDTRDIPDFIRAEIFAFIEKPWESSRLILELDRALQFAQVRRERDKFAFRAEEDLNSAVEFQRTLLEVEPPDVPGLALTKSYIPSKERPVGGDYYDMFSLDRTRLLICTADVAGNGVKPAFIAAVLKSSIYPDYVRLVQPDGITTSKLVEWLNERMVAFLSRFPDLFLSFSATLVNTRKMTIEHANAGQPPLIMIRENRAEMAGGTGMAIGVAKEIVTEEIHIDVNPGNQFVLLSDGLFSLSLDPYHETVLRFTEENVAALDQPESFVEAAVSAFADERDRVDDITVIAGRFL